MTIKGEPIGFDRGAKNVEGSETGEASWGKRHKKRDRSAGLQGLTGTWGRGLGQQDSECRTCRGSWRDISVFGKAVQDLNEHG